MTISLSAIETALRSEDIEGFIALGAPGDEYSSEARQIAAALNSIQSGQLDVATISATISLVWAKAFNRSTSEIEQRLPVFQKIAQQLVENM